ncbi:ATP-binding protein [Agrilactobacillus fermenti]|uniref:HAMP domain-containing sensor histidine kinase n=1 Tax=Agrilactobacillus fermenti TaxID=2586909 RepID=UPI001E387980|nr:HAMP domain-containing histidine kinase [Agrilactobacillus fermenti]
MEEQVAQPQKRTRSLKTSLKAKWTLGMSVIILGTLLLFSFVIYYTVRNVLLDQEKITVQETITAVKHRLDSETHELSADNVLPRLNIERDKNALYPASPNWDQTDVFQDSVIQKLSRNDINVGVYNSRGTQIFTTKATSLPLKNTRDLGVFLREYKHQTVMQGKAAIHSQRNNRLIGYIQVVDGMVSYHRNMERLRLFMVLFTAIAVLLGGLASFLIIRHFLRPIRKLSDAIELVKVEPNTQMRVPEINSDDELAELTDEFNHMLDKTQRFVDAQNNFVQDVSHELRTPVAVLEGHLQLLNRWGKDDPEVLDESLNASIQELQRMKYLIQEMLDLSRADQVEELYGQETTEVVPLVDQIYNNFKMLHPEFSIVLDLDLKADTFVRIYRNHLEQILVILMDNAVKYSENRKEIHLSASQDSRFVNIAVQDFGAGIPENDRKNIFNRFYRVDKARSRDKGGNGLGLSIAQRLIESYHGSISVESTVGSGSIFRIDVPLFVPEAEKEEEKLAKKEQ